MESRLTWAWHVARDFVRDVVHESSRVQLSTHAAAISAFALLSVVPLLLFALETIAAFFPNPEAGQEFLASVQSFAGTEAEKLVSWILRLKAAGNPTSASWWTEFAILAVAGMSIFLQNRRSLAEIFGRPPREERPPVLWRLISTYVVAIGMVIVTAGLFVALLFANAGIAFLAERVLPAAEEYFALPSLRRLHFAVSLALVTLLIGISWRLLALRKPPRVFVYPAAFVTAILLAVGNGVVGALIGRSILASMYGTAWSIIALVLWVQYSALAYLLGAVVTKVLWDRASTSSAPPPSPGA
jgi:membrane protein